MRIALLAFFCFHLCHAASVTAAEDRSSQRPSALHSLKRAQAKLTRLERGYRQPSQFVSRETDQVQKIAALVLLYEHELKPIVQASVANAELTSELASLRHLIAQKPRLRAGPSGEAQAWVDGYCESVRRLIELLSLSEPQSSGPAISPSHKLSQRPSIAPKPAGSILRTVEDSVELDATRLDSLERELLAFTRRQGITAYAHILALSGMPGFKRYASDIIIDALFRKADATRSVYHCAFVGSPGTGKTTVARLYGRLLFELGLIGANQEGPKFTEVSRSDLVGAHIGETEKKTAAFLQASLGGVLFIDEAHNLASGSDNSKDFGHRALNVINKFMEDQRDNIAVVFAGYQEQMNEFIGEDPGLRSRIARIIEFPDLDAQQLTTILARLYRAEGLSLQAEAGEHAAALLAAERQAEEARGKNAFGNGRAARNLFERSLFAQKRRLFVEYQGDIAAIPPAACQEVKASDLDESSY